MNAPVSVIIPCYNAERCVQRQIDAVLPQLRDSDELVLVDNLSTDGTRALLEANAAEDPRVRVASASLRPGVNHARNTGLAVARGGILLLCDADDVVRTGWVDAFRQALSEDGVAGGAATPVDADGQRTGPDLGLHHVHDGPAYPLGACMGMTRPVLKSLRGFDESFVGGHDEADFAWRAAAAGWEIRLAEGAHIDYLQRPDPRSTARQRRAYARTAIQLWTRHQDLVSATSISFKGAVRNLAHALPSGLRVLTGKASDDDALRWGWALGTVEGHLRYRILGQPPTRLLPEGGPR